MIRSERRNSPHTLFFTSPFASTHALITPHFSKNEEDNNRNDGENTAYQERSTDSQGINKVPYQWRREDLTKGEPRIGEADALRMPRCSCTG